MWWFPGTMNVGIGKRERDSLIITRQVNLRDIVPTANTMSQVCDSKREHCYVRHVTIKPPLLYNWALIFVSTAFPNSYLQRWRRRILKSPKDRATRNVGQWVTNEPLGGLMTFLHFTRNGSLCMISKQRSYCGVWGGAPSVVQHPVFIFYSARDHRLIY